MLNKLIPCVLLKKIFINFVGTFVIFFMQAKIFMSLKKKEFSQFHIVFIIFSILFCISWHEWIKPKFLHRNDKLT